MKVFITHSHGNRPLVRQVVKTLKQAGLDDEIRMGERELALAAPYCASGASAIRPRS